MIKISLGSVLQIESSITEIFNLVYMCCYIKLLMIFRNKYLQFSESISNIQIHMVKPLSICYHFPTSSCVLIWRKWKWKCHLLSHVQLCVSPWTATHQAPLSMGLSRQEYWSGLPCPPPGDLSDTGIKPRYPMLQADSLPFELLGKPK